MVKIERERWVLIRLPNEYYKEKSIFCGLARNYEFKLINEIKDTAIKTYLSKNKAVASFVQSWWGGYEMIEKGEVIAVKVKESIVELNE